MLLKKFFSTGIFLATYISNFAQEYSYKHFDNQSGLAGNTVYAITQDSEGYLWFATDNGLSRYDGKSFIRYTTKDGLPDNEVLKLFADSYGRTWISTFNKHLCYYYAGKIHTKNNDSTLQKIELNEHVTFIFETPNRKIYFQTSKTIIEIDESNASVVYELSPKTGQNTLISCDYLLKDNSLVVIINDSTFKYLYKKLHFIGVKPKINHKTQLTISRNSILDAVIYKKPLNFISANGKNGNISYINTHKGSLLIDTITGNFKEVFLNTQRVSYTFEDRENNLWFATLGNGVFKLKSKAIKHYPFNNNENNAEVYAVNQFNNQILAGISFGKAYVINTKSMVANKLAFPAQQKFTTNSIGINRLTSILPIDNSTTILGFDSYLLKLQNGMQKFAYLKPIKSLSSINNNTILVGTSGYAIRMRITDLSIIDTVYNDRCTKVKFLNNDYYIGTQNGLFINNKKFEQFNERITELITTKDSILWVGTNSNGVFGIKNKKLVFRITEADGLTGNNIKSMYANGNDIWIGTFNGLNKYNRLTKKITTYTTDDGLPSDIINAIYVENNTLWLGTNIGLVSFDEQKVSKTTFCNIDLVSIESSTHTLNANALILPYYENNIRFVHNGISLKSEKGVLFKYKMDGVDSTWSETTTGIVNYPSLPYGTFKFRIYALNKFGEKSPELAYNILVKKPFWLTTIFLLLVALTSIGLVAFFTYKYVQRIKKRNEEKTRFLNEIHYAKQMALQTQMNPHFIFNCLNNIQKFLFKNDVENTNKYLTDFATLIRITLSNADKLSISLEEEISYLTRYLEMEKLRFENKLNYEFIIGNDINIEEIEVPTMLLQPFIENSIKHGILNKKEGIGLVKIHFTKKDDCLQCKIIDNGIGRKESAKIKSLEDTLFESKGVSITKRRIEMLNYNKTKNVTLTINDLVDNFNNPLGTEVIIFIPLNFYDIT